MVFIGRLIAAIAWGCILVGYALGPILAIVGVLALLSYIF